MTPGRKDGAVPDTIMIVSSAVSWRGGSGDRRADSRQVPRELAEERA